MIPHTLITTFALLSNGFLPAADSSLKSTFKVRREVASDVRKKKKKRKKRVLHVHVHNICRPLSLSKAKRVQANKVAPI